MFVKRFICCRCFPLFTQKLLCLFVVGCKKAQTVTERQNYFSIVKKWPLTAVCIVLTICFGLRLFVRIISCETWLQTCCDFIRKYLCNPLIKWKQVLFISLSVKILSKYFRFHCMSSYKLVPQPFTRHLPTFLHMLVPNSCPITAV